MLLIKSVRIHSSTHRQVRSRSVRWKLFGMRWLKIWWWIHRNSKIFNNKTTTTTAAATQFTGKIQHFKLISDLLFHTHLQNTVKFIIWWKCVTPIRFRLFVVVYSFSSLSLSLQFIWRYWKSIIIFHPKASIEFHMEFALELFYKLTRWKCNAYSSA